MFYAAINRENRFYIWLEILYSTTVRTYGPNYANIPDPTTTLSYLLMIN